MVGYTALSQKDERRAMLLLDEHRSLVRPIFSRHNGHEVKTMGDAFLVEFASALEAVRCAFDIQESLHELNSDRPTEKRILLRIGVHLGDVIHSGNDVYGDAVNLASRIEPLATPGGICVTAQIYDHIRNKFEFPLASIGKKDLKNVGESVEVFSVRMPWDGKSETALDKRRIAVLPFDSLSPDPSDEYFADGLTEELIDRLCQVSGLEVISRTSVMSFKKKEKKAIDIARELSVGSLVEGSVRKAGNKVRVTAQLINGATEGHLWSSRYDKSLDDIFAVQSDIAEQVSDALKVRLLPNESEALKKKATVNSEAHTQFLKGRHCLAQRSPQQVRRGIGYFEQAVELDPSFALAYVGLADCYLILVDQGSEEPAPTNHKVRSLVSKALELDEGLAEAHATVGNLLQSEWDWKGAEAEFKRAIELNANYATSYHWYSILLARLDRFEQALEQIRIAHRLDPISPIINCNVGLRLVEAGYLDEGIEQFQKTIMLDPNFAQGHAHLGATYVSMGRFEEGIAEIRKSEEIAPNPWQKSWLGYISGLRGERTEALNYLRDLEELSRTKYVPKVLLGTVYFAIGEKEKAVTLFQQAYDERSSALEYIKEFRIYRPIREDPTLGALLEKMVSAGKT